MNKCFITKLPSSVDNDDLPVLGQLKVNWLKQSNLEINAQRAVGLQTTDTITVKVSGAHFTDKSLTSDMGNTKTITAADGLVFLYVSNDADAVLTIDNKYSLKVLDFATPMNDWYDRSVYFNIDDIKYCTNLVDLDLGCTKVNGNINAVSNLTNLNNLALSETPLIGDISALSNLTNLNRLKLSNSLKISGDFSVVSKLTNLNVIHISATSISGNINAISNLTKLTDLYLTYCKISGDISSLKKLTNLGSTAIDIKYTMLDGDMSGVPAQLNAINLSNRYINTNFTWTANGRQNATLLAMEGDIPFDTASMDNMFIDQATCTFKPIDGQPWTKIISVKGTRTSASDAAVTTIQNMGVTITGVTKQD